MITELKQSITKAVSHLKKQYGSLQAGKASVGMVEGIMVESYGSMMPLSQTANISCPDAKTLRIEPWDKSQVSGIEKAIQTSDIGINPQNMGTYILLPVPPMTEDRRRALVKVVKEEAEHAHISVRTGRAHARDTVKRKKDDKTISDDEAKKFENDIQKQVDEATKEIKELEKQKELDIMKV
jgi:ribosome recycling factor